jgi:hypothetical protein
MSAENKRSAGFESVALLMLVGLLIFVLAGVGGYCMVVLRLRELEALTVALGVLMGVACGGWIIRWMCDRRIRGLVLIDCGVQPYRLTFFVSVLLVTWVLLGPDSHVLGQWRLPLLGLWGAFALIGLTGRLQLTEAGVSHYGFLVPWLRISSHGWTRDGKLVIFTRSRWYPRFEVPISRSQRDEVDALMGRLRVSEPIA